VVAEKDHGKRFTATFRLAWFCACADSCAVFNTGPYTVLPDNSILNIANMQSETGFPSSHQLKSYVAYKSRPPEIGGARCPVSGCWPSCYSCNQLKLISVARTLHKINLPQNSLWSWTGLHSMRHNDEGLSGRDLMTSLGERKDRSFNKITGNWFMTRYFIEWPIFWVIGTVAIQRWCKQPC